MYRNLLNLLTCVLLLPACSGTAPHISVVCEENNVGNSIVKWEIAPLIKGNVKVYASTDPNNIPEDSPVAIANISDQRMTIVTTDPTKRYYYTLVFNDKYRVKIATRNVNIPGIQNFRDMGGYPSYPTKKRVRWGMLYRSAQIDSLECYSRRELKNLQLGYSLPKSVVEKVGISNCRVFVSGENLLTFTSLSSIFDPETCVGGWGGNAYPLSSTWSFGLSVTF